MATVEKRGDRYRVRYAVYENGNRVQRNRTFTKAKEAREFAVEVEYEIQTGNYADAGKITLKNYLTDYFDTFCLHMRPNTLHSSRQYMNTHIIPVLGNVRLKDLTTLQIQRVYNKMMQTEVYPGQFKQIDGERVMVKPPRTYAPKTVRNVNCTLSTALKKAVKLNLISKNPCENVTLPQTKRREYVIPDKQKLREILELMRETRYYEAVLTCAMLGVRRSEVLGLFWSDIDFQNESISFQRALIYEEDSHKLQISEMKTETSHRILPLPGMLAEALLSLRERQTLLNGGALPDDSFVFTNDEGQPIRPSCLSQNFKFVVTKAGLPNMRLHDLRHTVVTYLLQAGQSPKTVQEFVGHTDARFTIKQYAHVLEESKREASAALNKLLFTYDS